MIQQLTDPQLYKLYGTPNKTGEGYLVQITLPYPMRLAWDTKTKVTKISCHKKIAQRLLKVFNELLDAYGYDTLVKLGIDIYGGCFNYRVMRGGTQLSRHSWAVAIDLDPKNNGLKTPYLKAKFSGKSYAKMMDIFYKHGFLNLGKERDYDTMHFETFI